MQAAADAVAAPDEDEPAFGEMLHAHAQLAAIGQVQGLAPGAGADGAVQQRGAELVEEAPVHALALHQAHGACVAVGQDGFGIARRQDRKSTRLNSSHLVISYAVFCLKKKKTPTTKIGATTADDSESSMPTMSA